MFTFPGKRTLPREEQLNLLYRAATLLEESNQIEEAVAIFREAGHWDEMVALIKKKAPSMIEQGRHCSLREWLESLPKEILEDDPWLLYWMGESLLRFDSPRSRSYYERAFDLFKVQEDLNGVFLAWSGIALSIYTAFEDFKPLDQWISVLGNLTPSFQTVSSRRIRGRVASVIFLALYYRQPDHPEIEEWEEQVLKSIEDDDSLESKIPMLYRLAYRRIYSGDFKKAEFYVEQFSQLAQSKEATPITLMLCRYIEATYYHFIGPHEKCLKAVFDGLEIARNIGVHFVDHFLLGLGVGSALSVNDTENAKKLLDKMASLNRSNNWQRWVYHHVRALELLSRGDVEKASFHIGVSS